MMHQCPETINGFSVDSCVVKMSMEMPQVSATKKQQKKQQTGRLKLGDTGLSTLPNQTKNYNPGILLYHYSFKQIFGL